ncbi:helix-turn-helix domain-containing protein [Nocardia brasiliensis]
MSEAGQGVRPQGLTSAAPKRMRRLSEEERTSLAADYRSGMTVYELAAKYGTDRSTVSNHLKRMGVEMRRQGLSEGQIEEAVRLYVEQRWSLVRIAGKLGVDHGTVWNRLRERRVRMRDTQGRER